MIVVDTNVVSELMRPSPSPAVQHWVCARSGNELYTTAITVAEIRYSIERLPGGHNAALATRNLKDFRDTGIDVVDPWQHT